MSEKIGFTEQFKIEEIEYFNLQVQQPPKICVKCGVNLSIIDGWIDIKGTGFCGECVKKVFMINTDGGKDANS
ncbi:MAG: hypothetical protein V3U54_07645 [Thermodesulfobacteriota bacterium]